MDDPETYYDDHDQAEWDRLTSSLHGRLEWEGTVERLDDELPESGRVLDAGGGAGRYAVWLAERGYDVTLVDPSEGQRDLAREKVAERGLDERVSVAPGDVRELDFDPGAFDATLCLGGPLSHVLDADERTTAARELKRVTADGGPVFVSVMGRLNWLVLYLVSGTEHLTRADELAETGDYDRAFVDRLDYESMFTETHFFRADEFEGLLAEAGLDVQRLVGLEGLASVLSAGPLRDRADELSEDRLAGIRRLVDELRDDRTVADMSAHMLAVCRASG
ncbi:methyltransferase domain-containing protein [Halosimplex litoreum]|uniref:Methyltransferase domain-containing protein n=1 Tax=Halosimplex litoreum TaxID=1198301 RepID=A0A7U3WAR5_9EURY|nr:class I SAM-dependent methyltransferase [Halosimplex litoreum]QPV64710.1 methyltransferase domain-containing protein [Halosimplex litoreum]